MSNRIPHFPIRSAFLTFMVCICCTAGAADKAAQDQSKRLQQRLRATEREKVQIAGRNAELEARLKEAQDALALAKRRGEAAARRGATLASDLAALNTEKEVLRAKLWDTEQALAAEQRKLADSASRLAGAIRRGEEQRLAFAAEKERFETALSASREHNERMYKLGYDLIAQCERIAVAQAEPVTGLKRAQIEKMAEEDRDKFDKDRLPPVN